MNNGFLGRFGLSSTLWDFGDGSVTVRVRGDDIDSFMIFAKG
jgi:hypothetical protein